MSAARREDLDRAIYIISVAAELAGVHPQTLRVYERKGLVSPSRTQGNTRRYSERDILLLQRIQELTQEGINLAGVTRILSLEQEVERLSERYRRAVDDLDRLERQMGEAIDARNRTALVLLRDVRRVRRAMKSEDLDEAAKPRILTTPPLT